MFDFLTLSVVIDNQIFCVHGGMVLKRPLHFFAIRGLEWFASCWVASCALEGC